MDSHEWSGDRETVAERVREAIATHRLPARARVVAWGLPETGSRASAEQLPALEPLVAAGFQIEEILSPPHALARSLNARGIDTVSKGVAAVSLNTHGAAIAIVSRGELVSSRVFDWPLGRPFGGSRSELLERYLVIAQLAPQLQHLIDLVRSVQVGSIVLCGNLPDMRSISMLLIDELDVEVETLDSADLLGPACREFAGSLAALQLASAVAIPPRRSAPPPPVLRSSHSWLHLSRRTSVAAALLLVVVWSTMQVSGTGPAIPIPAPSLTIARPGAETTPVVPELRTEATMGRVDAVDVIVPPPAASPAAVAASLRTADAEDSRPVPRVDGIMISGSRALAIVDGNVVAPGDTVGSRTVVRIDRNGVVLRDSSRREVYVAIRTRKAGTDARRQP
jgi:hypothetical protein